MRLLLINDNHTQTGGAEHYFFDLKKRLKQVPGVDVYSLSFGKEAMQGDDYFVLKATRSNVMKLIWQCFFHPFIYFKLRQHLKKIQPDVIHIHNIKQYSSSLFYAIKAYPVVQTIHDYGAVCPVAHNIHQDGQPCPTGLRNKCVWKHQVKYSLITYLALVLSFLNVRRLQKKIVKKFFAPSPQLVDYLKRNQFHDVTYIAPFKRESQGYSFDKIDPYHFLFAGNLGSHKGIHVLIAEFALAVQKNRQLTLTLAGAGKEEAVLRKRIQALNLASHIDLIGWQENLHEEYEKSAAIIFPSLWMEAFGLVMTEAMSHARPVIGSNRGSPSWLIDDQKTGFIFDPLKKGDLARALLKVAGDISLIKKLGQQGYEKLQGLIHNDEVLQQILRHYGEFAEDLSRVD